MHFIAFLVRFTSFGKKIEKNRQKEIFEIGCENASDDDIQGVMICLMVMLPCDE